MYYEELSILVAPAMESFYSLTAPCNIGIYWYSQEYKNQNQYEEELRQIIKVY